jgi:hypothetical protein
MQQRPVLPRGTWTLNFFDSAGAEVVVAITADGRCIDWRSVADDTREEAVAILRSTLDTHDPVRPTLEVVR